MQPLMRTSDLKVRPPKLGDCKYPIYERVHFRRVKRKKLSLIKKLLKIVDFI